MDRDQRRARLEGRTNLVELGHLEATTAYKALKRSLPRTDSAMRLMEAVEALLGDRGFRDPYIRDGAVKLGLWDGDWLVAGHVASLALDVHRPPPPEPMVLPEPLREMAARAQALMAAHREANPEPEILPFGANQRPADLIIHEGPAHHLLRYDVRGVFYEAQAKGGGDPHYHDGRVQPHRIDPAARPPQLRPMSLLLREDLDPSGHSVEELARMVVAQDHAGRQPLRVRLPRPAPGGILGVRDRGLRGLKRAAAAGELPEEAGWLVADGITGDCWAWGPSLEAAHAAWLARLETDPPEVPEPVEPPPLPEGPQQTTEAEADEEGKELTIKTRMTIVIQPDVILPWPEPDAEECPCVAVPVGPLRPTPAAWQDAGYTRRIRLFSEHGRTSLALVRDEADGHTLVGGELLDVLDPDELDASWEEARAKIRAEHVDHWGQGDPWEQPRYPWHFQEQRVWDDQVGRWNDGLRGAGYGWTGGPGLDRPNIDVSMIVRRYWDVSDQVQPEEEQGEETAEAPGKPHLRLV